MTLAYILITCAERNHNIRIPGFSSDETRVQLAQAGIANAAGGPNKKSGVQGPQTSVRSHRVAQVQQAKREAKLLWYLHYAM